MLNKYIDHTVLKPDTTQEGVQKIINEAIKYKFMSVCVNPTWVEFAAEQLKNSEVKVCTVIGFPLGANTSSVKAYETSDAIANGADEVDMVINIGALKSGNDKTVRNDIKSVVDAAKNKALVKVIIETCLLTNEEKVRACKLALEAGADFVKTSTGFSIGGATVEDIRLMREAVGEKLGVKASGGIYSQADANAMIKAGATRIGTSAGVAIVTGLSVKGGY